MAAAGTHDLRALRQVLAVLADSGVIPQASSSLKATRQATAGALRETVVAEVPAFSTSSNPDILPGLAVHAEDHIQEIERLIAGGEVGGFDFVMAHAQRRAEQLFPLEATLHAYRCGQRVLSRWLRDAAIAADPQSHEQAVSAVADFAIEYTNAVSTIVASEYVAHARMLATAEGDRRTQLINILLSGSDESDGRAAALLKRAGYMDQRQSYCVVAAQSTNPSEMELPERAQRIANAIGAVVARTPIRVLAGVRNNLVTAVLSDSRRQSGWTAPQTILAGRLGSLLLELGPAVLVGVSTDQPSTSFLPRALHEATIALDFAHVGRRVVHFSDLTIRDLMLYRGGEDVRSVTPNWAKALVGANEKAKGTLLKTLRALADADLNVQRAGRELGVHPNTVYARLNRVRELTGLNGQRHHDLVELLLAADCWVGR